MSSPAIPDRAEWAKRIATAWHGARAKFLEAGRTLIDAKKALAHGQFEAMVADDLPFGKRAAQCLMAIGRDQRITNANHGAFLPPTWRTLYELTRLDDETFTRAIDTGEIHADMERGDVRRLLQPAPAPAAEAEARQARAVEKIDELVVSGERFAVILADPPWRFETYSEKGQGRSAERHYPTMADEDIQALPVGALAAEDCVLLLWATMPKLPAAFAVMAAWGFVYKTCGFNWIKQKPKGGGLFAGQGFWTRANAELCLLGARGSPSRRAADVEQVVMAPVMEHSRKPDEVHKRTERLLAGPYLELFARRERPDWTVWGDEVLN